MKPSDICTLLHVNLWWALAVCISFSRGEDAAANPLRRSLACSQEETHSCRQGKVTSTSWSGRGCLCDDLCGEYGDCCHDAEKDVDLGPASEAGRHRCVSLVKDEGQHMRASCPSGWVDEKVAALCRAASLEQMSFREDPLLHMPVTSRTSNVTYANYQCAVCHSDTHDVVFWNVDLKCPSLIGPSEVEYRNLGEIAVKKDLIHPDTAGNATVPRHNDGTCRNETILKDDYIMVNDTVVIKVSNRTYYPGAYEVVKEGVLVCSFASDKYSDAMGWVTLAGLSASSLCLVLHLVAFALVPHLRNLHGRNVASLSVSLLGAYVSYILSVFAETSTTECYVFAVLIYYLFLTSFSWMNVLGFDVFYTFRRSRVRSGEQWKRFLVYSAYGWVLPACAVAAVVAVDQTRPPGFPPEFLPSLGQHLCWFGRRKALLAFFGAPLIASIIMNVALFVATTVSIAKTMQSEVRKTSPSEPKKEFLLYLRLAVLMGITWITSVVASYLEEEVLWYVFILLNTLQGVFIFLAFTCRTKVWEAIAQPCQAPSSVSCCRRQESEPPASDQSGMFSSSTSTNMTPADSDMSIHSSNTVLTLKFSTISAV
ncbi:G-protein coupled receptor Mth2 [Penaeus vannamei]|uniref:G-protein coupled receptor Mth2 n=1 Tax=Penaeus vannamei TaxID=6689 RepID=A0A423TDJ0_PENVA|nr:G-protein coupled receptor Mth2 [Penaeus vannamei]